MVDGRYDYEMEHGHDDGVPRRSRYPPTTNAFCTGLPADAALGFFLLLTLCSSFFLFLSATMVMAV